MNTLFLLKLTLVPLLIAGVTLGVRRWGAGIGGWIGGFPWVAGPISFFMAWEQGATFAANTIPSALMGAVGTFFFAYTYSLTARRWSWLPTVLVGYGAFFVVALLAYFTRPPLVVATIVSFGILTILLFAFPKPNESDTPARQPRFDIPLRMLVATVFVVLLTQGAAWLGPDWSGILTPFPIMTSTLAVFTHAQRGADATARIMYGLMLTGYGFLSFLLGVYFVVPLLPIGWAYFLLMIGTLALNGITLRLLK